MHKKQGGFSILEVLVVVGIIGILSAIAVYSYNRAMMRAKQKRTMADMRSIGMAWEARAGDVRQYNAAGFEMPTETLTHAELVSLLSPNYLKSVPRVDGWGREFIFAVDEPMGSGNGAQEYAIRSLGADGRLDEAIGNGPTSDASADIVFSAGSFIAFPEGVQ